jgi:hypothetical protein
VVVGYFDDALMALASAVACSLHEALPPRWSLSPQQVWLAGASATRSIFALH